MAESLITPGVTYEFGNGVKGDCVHVFLESVEGRETGMKMLKNYLDGLVAQNVTGSIQKQPRQFYEIGTEKYYSVESRPSGSGSIDHIIGPNTQDVWLSLERFADVCYETNLYMGRKTDCKLCKDNAATTGCVSFRGGILNSFQVTATANDWVLTSRLGFSFYDLTRDYAPDQG